MFGILKVEAVNRIIDLIKGNCYDGGGSCDNSSSRRRGKKRISNINSCDSKEKKKTWLYVFIFNLIKRGIIVFILGRKNMKTEMCVYLSSCYLHFADLEMKYAAVVFKRIRLVAVVIESHYPL